MEYFYFLLETTKPGCISDHHFGILTLCLQEIYIVQKLISHQSLRAQGSNQNLMALLLRAQPDEVGGGPIENTLSIHLSVHPSICQSVIVSCPLNNTEVR